MQSGFKDRNFYELAPTNMQVILRPRAKQQLITVEKDHYWYDHKTKKMLHGRGGELRFKYDPELRRSVPYLVEVEAPIRGNNFGDIEKWVKNKAPQFGASIVDMAPNHFVLIDVDDAVLTEVEEDLYRHGISYESD